jgi:hypothetical protein
MSLRIVPFEGTPRPLAKILASDLNFVCARCAARLKRRAT